MNARTHTVVTTGMKPRVRPGLRFIETPQGGDTSGNGGAGAGDAGAAGGDAGADAAAATAAAATAAAAAAQTGGDQAGGDNKPGDLDISSLPEAAQKVIRDLRAENATRRTQNKTAAQEAETAATQKIADQIATALGIKPADSPVDPAALQAEIESTKSAAQTAARELAVYRAAGTLGGNANALLDSRSFLESVKNIDPTDATAIEAAVKEAVEKNAQFKVVQVPTRSGGDLGGGSGETSTRKPTSIADAISAHYEK